MSPYRYDGNANDFGASHPRYVNYLERDGPAAGSSSSSSGVGVGDVERAAAASSRPGSGSSSRLLLDPASSSAIASAVWPTGPFAFDMKRVNAAVNGALLSNDKLLAIIDGNANSGGGGGGKGRNKR